MEIVPTEADLKKLGELVDAVAGPVERCRGVAHRA